MEYIENYIDLKTSVANHREVPFNGFSFSDPPLSTPLRIYRLTVTTPLSAFRAGLAGGNTWPRLSQPLCVSVCPFGMRSR